MSLVVIYDYKHHRREDQLLSFYHPVICYTEKEFVKTQKDLREVMFEDLEALKRWASELTDDSELYLISNHDYNIGLDASSSADELKEIHHKYGEKLEISTQENDKGFFGKFF